MFCNDNDYRHADSVLCGDSNDKRNQLHEFSQEKVHRWLKAIKSACP